MPSFRLLNPFPVYLGNNGRPASDGYLRFYEAGTVNPKSVYGDRELTVDNGSQVAIGVDGRTVVDVWGNGSYMVRLYDQDNTLIDEADNVEIPGGTGTTIPALVDGWFLTNNGSLLLWAPVAQLPDPTGQSGKVLGTDGENYVWIAKPADGAPGEDATNVTDSATGFTVGDFMVQTGTGSFPSSGAQSSSVTVTFPTAMLNCKAVLIQMDGGTMFLHARVNTKSGTGFTATADSNIFGQAINSSQGFTYVAMGVKAP